MSFLIPPGSSSEKGIAMLDALWLFFLSLAAVPRPLKAFEREAPRLTEGPLTSRKCRKIGSS